MVEKPQQTTWLRSIGTSAVKPCVVVLKFARVSPDELTVLGMILSIASSVYIAAGSFLTGAVFLMLGFACDWWDGALARRLEIYSEAGAELDRICDRVSDAAVHIGMLAYFLGHGDTVTVASCSVSLVTAIIIPFAKAVGEKYGLNISHGPLDRGLRCVLLLTGIVGGPGVLRVILAIVAVLGIITANRRTSSILEHLP